MDPGVRRPLATRDRAWARALAAALARRRIAPNAISAASLLFAGLAGVAFAVHAHTGVIGQSAWLIVAAIGIQLRLLCNLLDGMVAVEGGLRTPTGELWNELPDRFADVAIIVGVGYGLPALPHAVELAWGAAAVALLTAYVRALGQQAGAPAAFHGPMAKPHRMALLTAAALAAAATAAMPWAGWILYGALIVIVVGGLVTVVRRTWAIAVTLRTRA